jgi:hypothetical protein
MLSPIDVQDRALWPLSGHGQQKSFQWARSVPSRDGAKKEAPLRDTLCISPVPLTMTAPLLSERAHGLL